MFHLLNQTVPSLLLYTEKSPTFCCFNKKQFGCCLSVVVLINAILFSVLISLMTYNLDDS